MFALDVWSLKYSLFLILVLQILLFWENLKDQLQSSNPQILSFIVQQPIIITLR